MPLVEQELITLLEHLSSTLVFSGIRVTWSLVLYVCFVDRCLSFCHCFFFGHCVVCPSSTYGFWFFLHIYIVITFSTIDIPSWKAIITDYLTKLSDLSGNRNDFILTKFPFQFYSFAIQSVIKTYISNNRHQVCS